MGEDEVDGAEEGVVAEEVDGDSRLKGGYNDDFH